MNNDGKEEQILSQITEEMRSMRNHFIVVKLLELKKGQCRATIIDPVRHSKLAGHAAVAAAQRLMFALPSLRVVQP